jgi:hypothetical protein
LLALRPGSLLILLAALCAAVPQGMMAAPSTVHRAVWSGGNAKSVKAKARAVQAQALLHRLSVRAGQPLPEGLQTLLADLLLVVEIRLAPPGSAGFRLTPISVDACSSERTVHYGRPPPSSCSI